MATRKIIQKWTEEFPSLQQATGQKLLMVQGVVLTGLELKKIPGIRRYRPYAVIYSLYGNRDGDNYKGCLSYPLYMKSFKTMDGTSVELDFDYSLPLNQMKIDLVRNQYPMDLLLAGDSIQDIGKVITSQIYFPPLNAAGESFLKAEILKSAYIFYRLNGEDKTAMEILEVLKRTPWDISSFKLWNVNPGLWMSKFAEINFLEKSRIVQENTKEFFKRVKRKG